MVIGCEAVYLLGDDPVEVHEPRLWKRLFYLRTVWAALYQLRPCLDAGQPPCLHFGLAPSGGDCLLLATSQHPPHMHPMVEVPAARCGFSQIALLPAAKTLEPG